MVGGLSSSLMCFLELFTWPLDFGFEYLLTFLFVCRLLNYTPPAVVIRLLTTNGLIAYITSWVLYLSGASSDPRLLLPAWISITTVCRNALIRLST